MRVAIVAVIVLATRTVAADEASDLVRQGLEEYRTANYTAAATTLANAYALDRKPDTLFAQAQAERLAGDCKSAVLHYRTVIELVPDFTVAKLVQQNLTICEKTDPSTKPDDKPAPSEPSVAAATTTTTTTTVEVRRTDKLAVTMFAVGGLALGLAGGLYVAASNNADASDKAFTLEDHNALADRASAQQTGMVIAAGAGVAMIAYGVVRLVMAKPAAKTDVAVVPTARGGTFWVTRRW